MCLLCRGDKCAHRHIPSHTPLHTPLQAPLHTTLHTSLHTSLQTLLDTPCHTGWLAWGRGSSYQMCQASLFSCVLSAYLGCLGAPVWPAPRPCPRPPARCPPGGGRQGRRAAGRPAPGTWGRGRSGGEKYPEWSTPPSPRAPANRQEATSF